jgi:hypothetical protein
MNSQIKFNFIIFFIVIIFIGIISHYNQDTNNKKNMRCTNKNFKLDNSDNYILELKEELSDNKKTIKILMKRSLFLESIINNMDMELKNLTRYIDNEHNGRNYFRFSH